MNVTPKLDAKNIQTNVTQLLKIATETTPGDSWPRLYSFKLYIMLLSKIVLPYEYDLLNSSGCPWANSSVGLKQSK